MNQLVFIENEKVVTDSITIAEMFGKEHKSVLRDIRIQAEYAGKEFSQHNFVPSNYEVRGKLYPKFSLTEEAFTLVVFSYNTKEAVQTKIKFIQEFKKMRELIERQQVPVLNERQALIQSLKLTAELAEEQEEIKSKVISLEHKLEEQIIIDHGQQRKVQKAVATRIYKITSDKDERSRLFRELYREIRDRFGVASYRDIKRKELEAALNYIEYWIPRKAS